jgi:hypothetical protein
MTFLCGRITSITPQSDAYPDSIAFSQSRPHAFPIQARIASSIKSPARHANSLTYLVIPRPYPQSYIPVPIRITRPMALLTRIVFLTRSAGALHITSIVYLNVTLPVDRDWVLSRQVCRGESDVGGCRLIGISSRMYRAVGLDEGHVFVLVKWRASLRDFEGKGWRGVVWWICTVCSVICEFEVGS